MSLRAVLFDAGNTLIFLDYPRLAEGVGRAVGMALTADALESRAAEAAAALERGTGTDRERAAAYLEALLLLAGVPHASLDDARTELYRLHRERNLWSGLQPGTADALARLRAAGLLLGVVSNSDGRVDAALADAGLREYFQVVVDSTLAGVEKPDPRIFRAALEPLGVPAGEALYVGDIYEVDVVGARAAGMDVVLVDPRGIHAARDVSTAPSVAALVDRLLEPDGSGIAEPHTSPEG